MPQNIDTGWTFGRLILEVAEEAGCADQTGAVAAIPSDAHDLDRIKRVVNTGYQEFIRADPQWSFRKRSFTITTNAAGTGPLNIGGSAGIMRLPRWLQKPPASEFSFIDENSMYGCLVQSTYARVKGLQQRNPQTGTPQYSAVHPIDSQDGAVGQGSGTAWALYLWPIPDNTYTLESEGHVYPYDMVELDERHIAGAEHDQTIKAFALKILHGGPHEDPAKKAGAIEEAARQFALSQAADVHARVGLRGLIRDPLMGPLIPDSNSRYGPTTGSFTAYGQEIG